MSAEDQFCSAMEDAGYTPPSTIISDGKVHRFSPTGRRGDNAAWYVFHPDGIAAGIFGDFRSGMSQRWCAKAEHDLTEAERQSQLERIKAAQRIRDIEAVRKQGEAASTAMALWDAAAPVVAHPHLTAKGVKPYGIRGDAHHLLVPMCDTASKLHSLQFIGPDGVKRFMLGGRVKGCYHAIGRPNGLIYACEGYATGATLHEATGHAVAVAFSAGNLLPVVVALRAKYPCLTLVVAADDDWKSPGNPGLEAAKRAAKAVGGLVVVPQFAAARPDKATDFNDLAALAGLPAVRECLAANKGAANADLDK
ncbi:toprim domain-containing protein [Variovorax paradoxus]|uniref:toprim domain-containing protein n=1 Tax=Variovorax paradoxus TaxID=34073 RepID=UPI003D64D6B9